MIKSKATIWSLVSAVAFSLAACGGGGDDGFSLAGTTSTAKLQSIEIQLADTSVAAGRQTTAHAIGRFSDGSTADITDRSSSSGGRAATSLSWDASPASTATVFNAIGVATLSTKAPGTVTVTATDFFSGVKSTAVLVVTAAVPASLAIAGLDDGETVSARTTQALTALIVNSDNSKTTSTTATWTSSNTAVATIDSNGNFHGVAAGTVTIQATSGGFTRSISLTLLAPVTTPLVTISCDPSHPTTVNAQQWNNQFAIDKDNATEWVVVDGVSCQSYAVVELLVPQVFSTTLYNDRFIAERSASNPAVFKPGMTLGNLSAGQVLTIGSSTSLNSMTFTLLYTTNAQ